MNNYGYQCSICKKDYSSIQSLCNHTSKIHNKTSRGKETKCKSNDEKRHQEKLNINNNNTSDDTTNIEYKCKYCPKSYKFRQSRYRHQNNCLHKPTFDAMQTRITELEQKLAQITTPQTQTNNGTINNTINNGDVNNGTINNNYIIKFGSEDLSTILSKEDMIKICNKKFSSIEESIKMTHFDKDKPELNNIIIKNLRDDYAYIHDGDEYIVQNKNDIIADLIELHLDNIEMIINEENENNIRNKLDKKVIEKLEHIRDRLDDESEVKINEKRYDNYKSYKINQIKILIYNCIRKLKIIMNK